MNETERRFLRRLRDADSHGLPRSSIPKSCHHIVESLQLCGAAQFRPTSSGRGVALSVANDKAFGRFVAARLPGGLEVHASDLKDRASAVALLADSKAVRQALAQGILLRSAKANVEIRATDGELLPVGRLTQQAGAAGIQLSPDRSWTFAGSVLVIENADTFWRYETVLADVDLAIHGAAALSNRLTNWLASPAMHDCQLIHWGDYDPVGVYEYTRLVKACPERVVPYAPPEIDDLLPQFGKRSLIIKQSKYLDRLRNKLSDPYVARMVRLFDLHRRGLEQELLLQIARGNHTVRSAD